MCHFASQYHSYDKISEKENKRKDLISSPTCAGQMRLDAKRVHFRPTCSEPQAIFSPDRRPSLSPAFPCTRATLRLAKYFRVTCAFLPCRSDFSSRGKKKKKKKKRNGIKEGVKWRRRVGHTRPITVGLNIPPGTRQLRTHNRRRLTEAGGRTMKLHYYPRPLGLHACSDLNQALFNVGLSIGARLEFN